MIEYDYHGLLASRDTPRFIFRCSAISLNMNLADLGNKTPQDPRHIIYQTDQKALNKANGLSGVSWEES